MEWTLQGLVDAFYNGSRDNFWKRSTQHFEMNLLSECVRLKDELVTERWRPGEATRFKISERGKVRDIAAIPTRDRVAQRCFCDECFVPRLLPYLCYDNGATIEGKGVEFSRNRFVRNLIRAYDRWGGGYVLQTDFKSYFASIPHEGALRSLRQYFDDHEMWFISTIVGNNPGDRGLGLGSQVSQTIGVWYPTSFDNYVRCVRGYGLYGRYMDDAYVVAKTKAELWDLLDGLRGQALSIGISLNERKTRITPIGSWVTFLKVRYRMKNGVVESSVLPDTFRRERRRIKAYSRLELPEDIVRNAYRSWRGGAVRNPTSLARVLRTDEVFMQEFGDWRIE